MANFTRNAIKDTFIKMLNERPLSQISVKDITSELDINRNTFYYHFHDIPQLIEEIIIEES
ncbi:MAG: TetR/AcrR family transcriptional regulator, partial [Clostridia bacterium]|nr:TetR/AcrR family transcriptional regulator [Clostridia bacterium]